MGYNLLYNEIYDLGYEPNVCIVKDGFTKKYRTREEAYAEIKYLGEVDAHKYELFKNNVDQFLSEEENGEVTFLMETRSAVIWWEVNPREF